MMKKITLSFLVMVLFVFSQMTFAATSLESFKQEVGRYVSSEGSAMAEMFHVNSEPGIVFLKSVKTTALYKTCVHPSFWTGKETQIRACSDLSQKISREMPQDNHAPQATQELNARDAEFQTYIQNLPEEKRVSFSQEVKSFLITQYNEYFQECSQWINQTNQQLDNLCWGLSLGESAECRIDKTLQFLQNDFPVTVFRYHQKMSNDVEAAQSKVINYVE